ncbi:hypothetical protein SCHPADRAFT_41456 [Schizopora paradoxa]|uniref:Uncharacterized protein n=1 Tax=Schizopora paradoxa TaxID=27342 RepID=A0A0H2S6D7_9AGAM|nr:hypothetical protein SCHPADRAFT_41456 [Schizopora paradoxa]
MSSLLKSDRRRSESEKREQDSDGEKQVADRRSRWCASMVDIGKTISMTTSCFWDLIEGTSNTSMKNKYDGWLDGRRSRDTGCGRAKDKDDVESIPSPWLSSVPNQFYIRNATSFHRQSSSTFDRRLHCSMLIGETRRDGRNGHHSYVSYQRHLLTRHLQCICAPRRRPALIHPDRYNSTRHLPPEPYSHHPRAVW